MAVKVVLDDLYGYGLESANVLINYLDRSKASEELLGYNITENDDVINHIYMFNDNFTFGIIRDMASSIAFHGKAQLTAMLNKGDFDIRIPVTVYVPFNGNIEIFTYVITFSLDREKRILYTNVKCRK